MNVCVTVNSKYEKYLFVMLQSLYENHAKGDIHLFVIQRDFTDFDKEDIRELSVEYKNKVTYIMAHPQKFDNFPVSNTDRNNLSLEIYFRLLLPEYLPREIDRVLMLDVDIVVNRELRDLYNIDFQEHYLAAAPNMCRNFLVPEGWRVWYPKERKHWTHYNTGILMWNLKKIREDFPTEYIFHQGWKYSINTATFEEELFNIVFGESGILPIPAETYNYICTHEKMFEQPNFHVYPDNETLKKNCAIVHYAALNPWQGGMKNEKFCFWWEMCKKTKYYHKLLEECYEESEQYLIRYFKEIQEKKTEFEKRFFEMKSLLKREEQKLKYVDLLLDVDVRTRVLIKLKKLSWNSIIIYGASRAARCLANLFAEGGIEIVCFVDKNYQGVFCGHTCVSIPEMVAYETRADVIIISNSYYLAEIMKDLKSYADCVKVTLDELLEEEEECNMNIGTYKKKSYINFV